MATLEVHDDRGSVEQVSIAPEGTALIGSDPKCDVVLVGPEILPIHARLRWKKGRLKVEATPDAYAVEVNGKKVVASKLHPGDEIRIGGFRVFLMNLGKRPTEGEPTRIQEPPPARVKLEAVDWARDIEVAPPSLEAPVEVLSRGVAARGASPSPSPRKKASVPKPEPLSPLRRVLQRVVGTDVAPGEERLLSSPVILGLGVAIVLLVLMSAGLWRTIARRSADNRFQRALETYQDGDYLNAAKQFQEFLRENPADQRAGRARVLGALAGVRQYAGGAAPAWTEALAAARAMLQEVGEEPAFDDSRADLAETVLHTTEGLAERAARTADPQTLAEAEAALALTKQLAGPGAESLESRSRVPAKIATARAAVRKGVTRLARLKAMDEALKAGSAAGVYAARDELVNEYPDLAGDKAVVERLTRGNELLRQAVTFDPTPRPAETEARPDPLGPATTLSLRSVPKGWADPQSPTVLTLVEGLAVGLAESDGAPRWQVPVGAASPFPPQSIGGEPPTALVVDARHDDLLRIDTRDGRLVWRQSLGEPVQQPPLVLGNDLFQVLPSGDILRIDLTTGELRGTLHCHTPLAGAPAADELGAHLYVAASRANLFIFTREPLACVAVDYLGHERGSVPCAPARVGRYLILPLNDGLVDGHWQIFLLEQEGTKVRPVQRIPVTGWTWQTPAGQGAVLWTLGDRGGLTAYAIGAETERQPFQLLAEKAPDARPAGPVYALARSEREVWVASAHPARYDLSPERGKLATAWTLVDAGPAMAPLQYPGRLVVLTQQPREGRGVELWGLDPADGSVYWQTVLGASWSSAPTPTASGLAVLDLDGRPVSLTASNLEAGGFVEQTIPGPGAFRLPAGRSRSCEVGESRIVVPREGSDRVLVGRGDAPLRPLELPSALATEPVPWNQGLVVAGVDGLVYWIDPDSGSPLADPFVPPFDRDRPTRWLRPTVVSDDVLILADAAGRVRKLTRQDGARSRLVAAGPAIDLGSAPVAPPVASSTAVILATADGNVRSLAARDLSPLGAWPLPEPLALGPIRAGEMFLAGDAMGRVLALGPDGLRAWSAELGARPVGGAVAWGDSLWLLDDNGVLHGLSVADGSEGIRVPLDMVPAGGPIPMEAGLGIPSAPGSLRLWRPDALTPREAE